MQTDIPTTWVTLDSSSAIKLMMSGQMSKERGYMARNDVWHRVKIVRGARYEKELILRTILQAVEPADLIPVRYQVNGEDAYFMARNCGPALEMLCRSNLIINIPNGDSITMIITLAFASIHNLKINIQPILLAALTRSYNATKKSLTLEDFHRDEEISKTVYCPLSQTKTLSHTLKLAKTALGPFVHLNLQHNELQHIQAMVNSNLTFLRSLDLRNNYLMAMDTLGPLKALEITELWLDGNPLCENYANNIRYIDGAKKYCPNLKKLDGVTIDAPELPLTYVNHYPDYHSKILANQFLEHFYNFYDHGDKKALSNLYHKSAIFSMTFGISSGRSNRNNLGPFIAENRNLLNMPDHARDQLLYRGPDEIVEVLRRLPHTLHDRKGFKIDVIIDHQKRILLNLDGAFKTPASQILSFSRTFLLVASMNDEYNILNDQLHVNCGSTDPFYDDPTIDASRILDKMLALTPKEEERMIVTLMNITSMNGDWCRQFLNNANWNLRNAIQNFMDCYKTSQVPSGAFER